MQGIVEACLRCVAARAATHLISIPIRLLHTYLRCLLGHRALSDPTQTAGLFGSLDGPTTRRDATHTHARTQTLQIRLMYVVYLYLFIEVIVSKNILQLAFCVDHVHDRVQFILLNL